MTPEEKAALTDEAARRRREQIEGDRRRPLDARDRDRERQGRRRQVVADRQPRRRVHRARPAHRSSLDADVYGHSIPHLLGISQRPVAVDQMIVPPGQERHEADVDRLLPRRQRARDVARARCCTARSSSSSPTSTGASSTCCSSTCRPGTGDVAISLGQLLPRAEAIVVTTPQPLAQEVAIARGADGAEDRACACSASSRT